MGYRPWMQTGISLTDNQDFSYFGLRKVGSGYDVTETTISWSDNINSDGPDDFTLRFFGDGNGNTQIDRNNLRNGGDLDGLHLARFTPTGLIGFGNTFGVNPSGTPANLYVRPQSLLHMSYDWQSNPQNAPYGFLQITYRHKGGIKGSGETDQDGLRLGIDNTLVNGALNSYLRWQENTPFIVQTDWDNNSGGSISGERLRVCTTASPGVPASPLNATNTTRVAISYFGNLPISQPRALLHIGNNINGIGYASWMDYGNLTSNASQSIFTGITPANYSDANKSVIGFGRSDLLIMHAQKGEFARFHENSGFYSVGNYGPNGLNTAATERIDVDGNGRFRDIS
jgi:hypothetical protein